MNSWRNKSPGDLSIELPEVHETPVEPAVELARSAAGAWAGLSLDERIEHLRACQKAIEAERVDLAMSIAVETGKPLAECSSELAAVIAKFELSFGDARRFLAEESPPDAPHPARVRRRPRGPAAVIGPFNFPIHLAHGQIVPHLLAGNPVIFKPSPVSANVCAKYASIMSACLPAGVFNLVQGGAEAAQALCVHPAVRSIGFTGSVPAGKAIARAIAGNLSKDVALELGGKCAAIICADADLDRAAELCAQAACLTAGQRCNATSRILVDQSVRVAFIEKFVAGMHGFVPGDPTVQATRLGPLATQASLNRYERLTAEPGITWLKRGHIPSSVAGKVGYYVEPAVALFSNGPDCGRHPLVCEEVFAPIVAVVVVDGDERMVRVHNDTPFGLTATVFTRSEQRFRWFADRLEAGNVYANLPTTFSPSQLPFGGWKESGNGRPGGRGFVRFVSDEQVVQWEASGFAATS